tara:strand:- start:98 stop:271 length:174 start_codon:yes stop_codon:yes gene_type:complete
MKNPIEKIAYFKTPTIEELQAFVDSTHSPSESVQVMAMTINLCHQLIEEQRLAAERQ